jgi:hypothetical protein
MFTVHTPDSLNGLPPRDELLISGLGIQVPRDALSAHHL